MNDAPPPSNVFRTKTGYCHVLADRIVLTRDGVLGSIAQVTVGDGIGRTLAIHLAVAVLAAYACMRATERSQTIAIAIWGGVALAIVYLVIMSWNNSAAPIIERSAIQKVIYKPATPGVTRAHFQVYFTTDSGRSKKRLIMLPGSLTGVPEDTEQAVRIMREQGLLQGV